MKELETLIDKLSDEEVIQLHEKLIAGDHYTGIFNPEEIGKDPLAIRNALKIVLAQPWISELDFVPQPIREAVAARSTSGQNSVENFKERVEPGAPPNEFDAGPAAQQEKEKLLDELVVIAEIRTPSNQIQDENRARFGFLLDQLVRKHGVTLSDLQDSTGMTRQNLSKFLKKYRSEHVEPGLPLKKGESFAEKGVKKTLEGDISKFASELTSKYLDLGKTLFERYEARSSALGYSLPNLANKAISSFLFHGDFYSHMLKLENENQKLREEIHVLETMVIRYDNRIKSYERTLTII